MHNNNNDSLIDHQPQSLAPEEGRINFSKKQPNHGTKHVVKMLGEEMIDLFSTALITKFHL
jgi:hypothetical protein